MIRGCASRAGS